MCKRCRLPAKFGATDGYFAYAVVHIDERRGNRLQTFAGASTDGRG
jgi:hypothetical protein